MSSELEEIYSFYVDSNLVHELQGFDLALNHLELVLIAPKLGLAVLESGFVEQVFRVVNQGKRGKATLTTSEGMNQCLFLYLVLHLYLNVGPKHRFSSQKDVLKSDDFSKVRVVRVLQVKLLFELCVDLYFLEVFSIVGQAYVHNGLSSFEYEVTNSEQRYANINREVNSSSLLKLAHCSLMVDVNPIFVSPRLRVPVKHFEVKICKNLTNELSLVIEHVEELRFIATRCHRIKWYSEFTNYLIGEPSEKLGLFILESEPHIRLKSELLVKFNHFGSESIPNWVTALSVFGHESALFLVNCEITDLNLNVSIEFVLRNR